MGFACLDPAPPLPPMEAKLVGELPAGERAMLKVKPVRTADCVLGGFRHGTRFLRWRADKAPEQCGMDQIG